ncbi:phosphoadenosine phosphosulfate reductase family protein (plasmid) [Acetobacter orientalis]|uniref:phosphoadenosine phosphosulfate reductase domain-containing protein n=1 Tax=Acetobacter orientalis TaxID=146474 RepID=UPI00386E168F
MERINLASYDRIIVACSGGKDSIASLLHLLECGALLDRMELWHHDVDGQGPSFMDWPSTTPYVHALANYFEIPCYLSWREGGLKGEILRKGVPTAAVLCETPAGLVRRGGAGPVGTRLRFPQVSASLSTRYCSATAKIDVADMALRAQDRFLGSRTLFVTGERAEESPNRARYAVFGPHRTDTRDSRRRCRLVDHYRPVHAWNEAQIWAILRRYGVIPALPYQLGFGRLSCALCVFMSVDQAATLRHIMPERFGALAALEQTFGCTMKRECGLHPFADRGRVYKATLAQPDLVALALERQWHGPVVTPRWVLPAGAFGENVGPG